MNYFLDNTSAKFICPECKENTFVRYKNDQNQYLPSNVGRCDRENSCGYHYKAIEYFQVNNIEFTQTEKIEKKTEFYQIDNIHLTRLAYRQENEINYIYTKNNFIRYIIDVLKISPEKLKKHMIYYNVFTDHKQQKIFLSDYDNSGLSETDKTDIYNDYMRNLNYINQSVKFCYINEKNQFLTCKELLYKDTFKRDRLHERLLHIDYCGYDVNKRVKLCLFGLHLLDLEENYNKDIIIIESEKTAFIMSLFYPKYVWLATGGLNNISNDYDYIDLNVKYFFLPDSDIDKKGLSCAYKWKNKIAKSFLFKTDFKVIDFHLLCNEEQQKVGYDILDLHLNDPQKAKEILKNLNTIRYD
jgi:hypothetical protein